MVISNTIWEKIDDTRIELDYTELEELFKARISMKASNNLRSREI